MARDVALPHAAILRVKWSYRSMGHFVVKVGPTVHDPALAGPLTIATWQSHLWIREGRVTSYLRLDIDRARRSHAQWNS